jgi:hypothetical protein
LSGSRKVDQPTKSKEDVLKGKSDGVREVILPGSSQTLDMMDDEISELSDSLSDLSEEEDGVGELNFDH